ncbi:MAG: DUF3789 domain-containing protein [Oscillospiraceae bacterium]|nr:DUF3789 domain-containing protein [Oscillospiraceae bacterium]
MIGFFLGSLFGGTVGVVATCLCVAAGQADHGIDFTDSEP